MRLRTIELNDYSKLFEFWKKNYFVSEMDDFEHFSLFLGKNHDLSILAEENGEIVGTALGSHDGRRGYLQKVVTSKILRKKGIGKRMVKDVIDRLRKVGAICIPISVEDENITFYEKCGFIRKNSVCMNLDL